MAREMKDSGIEWAKKIPSSWNLSKLKDIGNYTNGYAFKPSDWEDNGLPIVRIQDLTGSNSSKPNFYSGSLDKKYLIKHGDILVSWAATLDTFIWENGDAWLNQHIMKAEPMQNTVTKNFFFWVLKIAMANMNNDNKHGIMMQHATIGLFSNYKIPLPPLSEQQKIADFLDEKVKEIDNAIEKTKETIELYKKYKQAIITEAVTKGLDPNVEMKDSGVNEIGDIPEKWKMIKIRNIGIPQNGISKSGEFFGSGYPFISYSDVYKNISLPQTVNNLIKSSSEERIRYSVKRGDIFFTRTSETIDEVGLSSVCLKTIKDATFAGFLIRVRPNDNLLVPEYSRYYFRNSYLRNYLAKEMNLVTRASLGQNLLKNMPVILPDKDTQLKIVYYLDDKCSKIDHIIYNKVELISKLEACKKSLIYEYVTGKKEVK